MNASSSRWRWIRFLLFAAASATAATTVSHLYIVNHEFKTDLEFIAPTVYYDKYIRVGPEDFGCPEDISQYPRIKSFIDMVIDRASIEKCPNNKITSLCTWYVGSNSHRGWPFASRGWSVNLGFECSPRNSCVNVGFHQSRTGETGPSSIRFNALIANWFVYFFISFALITIVSGGLAILKRRRNRNSTGFPVDLPR